MAADSSYSFTFTRDTDESVFLTDPYDPSRTAVYLLHPPISSSSSRPSFITCRIGPPHYIYILRYPLSFKPYSFHFPNQVTFSRLNPITVAEFHSFESSYNFDKLLVIPSPSSNKYTTTLFALYDGGKLQGCPHVRRWDANSPWVKLSKPGDNFDDIVCFENKVYVVDRQGISNLVNHYKTLSKIYIGKTITRNRLTPYSGWFGWRKRFVVDGGILYLVVRIEEKLFHVFRLRKQSKIRGCPCIYWERVSEFGGKVLFMAKDYCFFQRASRKFPGREYKNCIVFSEAAFPQYAKDCWEFTKTDDRQFSEDDIAVFRLGDERFAREEEWGNSGFPKIDWSPPDWILNVSSIPVNKFKKHLVSDSSSSSEREPDEEEILNSDCGNKSGEQEDEEEQEEMESDSDSQEQEEMESDSDSQDQVGMESDSESRDQEDENIQCDSNSQEKEDEQMHSEEAIIDVGNASMQKDPVTHSRYAVEGGVTKTLLRMNNGNDAIEEETSGKNITQTIAKASTTSSMTEENPWDSVTLKLWFGGSFSRNEKGLVYTGSAFRAIDVNVDEFGWFTILEEAEKCVCYSRKTDAIFFMDPNLGLQRIVDDVGAQVMCKVGVEHGVVECYLVSSVEVACLMQLIEVVKGEENGTTTTFVKCSKKLTPRRKEVSVSNTSKMGPPSKDRIEYSKQSTPNQNIKETNTYTSINQKLKLTETLKECSLKIPETSSQITSLIEPTSSIQPHFDHPYNFNDITLSKFFASYEKELESEDLSEGADPGYDPDLEEAGETESEGSEVEIVEDGEDNIVEPQWESYGYSEDEETKEAKKTLKEWNSKAITIAKQVIAKAKQATQPTGECVGAIVEDVVVSDYDNSADELETPGESEDEPIPGKRKRFAIPTINERSDFSKLKWCVGIRFPSREIFRECVARYAIAQGRNLIFVVSDKSRGRRLGVKCKVGCPFKLYGSWDNKSACFLVKSVNPSHNCHRTMESNRQLKSSWVAKQFLEVFKNKPHWPAADIIDTVRKAYKVIIKKGYAYKVKYYAHKMLHGSMKDHYSKFGRYMAALQQHYPTSVFTLSTIPSTVSSVHVFHRFFVCFDALRQGWLAGCRKLICVDACFLKTFLGGQLISAIGRDGNDQMYPLAWAVVEGENNDSYDWFFQELKKATNEEDGEGWTIISDEHQSIVSMVAKQFPKAEHRRCARHIFANWHKSYKGDEMKMLFWNCALAYNQADFDYAIASLKEVDPRASEAFMACNPTLFCRAFICTNTVNAVIVNNMAETFNAFIINARSKHLIDMLEDIRTMLMTRLAQKRKEMEETDNMVCPNIQEILEKEKEKAANCTPHLSSPTQYQVNDGIDVLGVDLAAKTCTCRKWDVTGIPCSHAIAAVFDIHATAEDFVHPMYSRETYLKAYGSSIVPCPGERYWPKVDMPMVPPPIKVGPGRPRKKRRRDPHEDPKKKGKLTKHGLEMSCSLCRSKEHNKRRCPDKGKIPPPPPKRGKGRPKAIPVGSGQEEGSTSQVHHRATALPTRLGRGGRVIRNGRGGTRGGRKGGARGGQRAPQGMGVLIDAEGNAFTNVPGSTIGPRNIASAMSMTTMSNERMSHRRPQASSSHV